jgi:hypothetical protein
MDHDPLLQTGPMKQVLLVAKGRVIRLVTARLIDSRYTVSVNLS